MTFWPFRRFSATWQDGFKEGYKKAYESMMPVIQETAKKSSILAREMAIDELLKNNPRLRNDRIK